MTSDPQCEYAEALAAYRDILARLVEAKKRVPETSRDRRKRELREERERRAAIPPSPELLALREATRQVLLDWEAEAERMRNDVLAALGAAPTD